MVGVDVDIRSTIATPSYRIPWSNGSRCSGVVDRSADVVRRVRDAVKVGNACSSCSIPTTRTSTYWTSCGPIRPLVTTGELLVVFDTVVEHMPDEFFHDRPWRSGNSPQSAVNAFLRETSRFEIDRRIDEQLLISVAPNGFLRCGCLMDHCGRRGITSSHEERSSSAAGWGPASATPARISPSRCCPSVASRSSGTS